MMTQKSYILLTILLLVLVSTNRVDAQKKDISSQVTLANELYHEKNYQAAANLFEDLVNQGEINGYLYYNLGNTYMRLGSKGHAISSYLQAQSLIPRNESLDANLRYAINQTQDQLSPPLGGLITGIFFWVDATTLLEHFQVLILFNFIFWCICVASLYYRKSLWSSLKSISLTILLIIFLSTGIKYHQLSTQKLGVIIDKKVAVKSDRSTQNITLFELHEGAIILVHQEDGKWAHIEVEADKSGWIPIESINF
jgi:tetratricopeptide (TPR) repeat protein